MLDLARKWTCRSKTEPFWGEFETTGADGTTSKEAYAAKFKVRSLKAQMREANAKKARMVLILGPDEVATGKVNVKNMEGGAETAVALDRVVDFLRGAFDVK